VAFGCVRDVASAMIGTCPSLIDGPRVSRQVYEAMLTFGYIDPGAGSLVVQALIAGAVSLPFLLRSKLRAAVARIRRRA